MKKLAIMIFLILTVVGGIGVYYLLGQREPAKEETVTAEPQKNYPITTVIKEGTTPNTKMVIPSKEETIRIKDSGGSWIEVPNVD